MRFWLEWRSWALHFSSFHRVKLVKLGVCSVLKVIGGLEGFGLKFYGEFGFFSILLGRVVSTTLIKGI